MSVNHSIKIVVNPAYEGLRPLVESLAATGRPCGARMVYDERNSLYALPWPEGVNGAPASGEIIVKDFHPPKLINSVVYTHLRKSKARRSYENALRLLDLGFNTPQPYAYVEVHRSLRLMRSYYLCAALTPDHLDMRYFDTKSDLEPLLAALGDEMRRLHQAGVLVKDFSPGNVLYVRRADGTYSFSHIDLNRVEFGVRSHKRLAANFRAMACTLAEVELLADAYANATGLPRDHVRQVAADQYTRFMRRVERKRTLKRTLARIFARR